MTIAGSSLSWQLFCFILGTELVDIMTKLTPKLLCLCSEGVDRMGGVHAKFCVGMPCGHVEGKIK